MIPLIMSVVIVIAIGMLGRWNERRMMNRMLDKYRSEDFFD